MFLPFCCRSPLRADEDYVDGDYSEEDDEESDGEDEEDTSPAEAKSSAIRQIDRRLGPIRTIRTKLIIKRVFREYADVEDDDGKIGVSREAAADMVEELAEALRVPEWVFRGQDVLFERFDFCGNGMLNERECSTMYLRVLQQRRIELGGRRKQIKVPESTIQKSGYTVVNELGRGGQGVMYLCSKRFSWRQYCVKFYPKAEATTAGILELIDEFALMKSLNSPHVAKTYEVFQDRSFYYLVNEPYFGGDLTKLGKKANDAGVSMSEDWWRRLFRQCVDGVSYLHGKSIIHADIKEPNIMIADGKSYQKPRPVLIDFGLSVAMGSEKSAICGTPGYIPPETWRKSTWYPKGDVFSLGITMFQLLSGRVPRVGEMGVLQDREIEGCAKAAQDRPLPWDVFPADEMPVLKELVESMTVRNRHDRLHLPGVASHEWFESDSDAALPEMQLLRLIGKAAEREAQDALVQALAEGNNLDELRQLNRDFVAGDPLAKGLVEAGYAVELLRARLAPEPLLQAFTKAVCGPECTAIHPFPYTELMKKAIEWKGDYGQQYIQDLFSDLDVNQNGFLSKDEIVALLNGPGFECPFEDIKELTAQMNFDKNGYVSYGEFKKVVVEDGRIAGRGETNHLHSVWEVVT